MESGKPRSSKRTDETHFGSFFPLERVSQAPKDGDGVGGKAVDDDSHNAFGRNPDFMEHETPSRASLADHAAILSECRESNPGYTHPKRA